MVKVGSDAKRYPGGSQALLDPFFFQFQLSFGQVEIPLLLLNAPSLLS